jgi:hypothetical protein
MRVLFKSFPRVHTLPEHEQELFEVGADQWRTTAGGILISEHACENLLVVGHNTGTRNGLVGQFSQIAGEDPPLGETHPEFEAAIGALEGLGNPAETWVWLGAAALEAGQTENPAARVDRNAANLRIAARLPTIAGMRHNWIVPERDCMHVMLEAGPGVIFIQMESGIPPAGGAAAAPVPVA